MEAASLLTWTQGWRRFMEATSLLTWTQGWRWFMEATSLLTRERCAFTRTRAGARFMRNNKASLKSKLLAKLFISH
jgi:hypothetical protein